MSVRYVNKDSIHASIINFINAEACTANWLCRQTLGIYGKWWMCYLVGVTHRLVIIDIQVLNELLVNKVAKVR